MQHRTRAVPTALVDAAALVMLASGLACLISCGKTVRQLPATERPGEPSIQSKLEAIADGRLDPGLLRIAVQRIAPEGPQFQYRLDGRGRVESQGDGVDGLHPIDPSGMRDLAREILYMKGWEQRAPEQNPVVKGRYVLEIDLDGLHSRIFQWHSTQFHDDPGSIGHLHRSVMGEMALPRWFTSLRDRYWPAFAAWMVLALGVLALTYRFLARPDDYFRRSSRRLDWFRAILGLSVLLDGAVFVLCAYLQAESANGKAAWIIFPCTLFVLVTSLGALWSVIFLSSSRETGRARSGIFTSTVSYETTTGYSVLLLGARRTLLSVLAAQVVNVTFLLASWRR